MCPRFLDHCQVLLPVRLNTGSLTRITLPEELLTVGNWPEGTAVLLRAAGR